jgi:hypothetical protein
LCRTLCLRQHGCVFGELLPLGLPLYNFFDLFYEALAQSDMTGFTLLLS